MNCPTKGLLQAFLDGEASRDERKQIALHLERCKECQQALNELRRLEEWGKISIEESYLQQANDVSIDVDRAWERFKEAAGLDSFPARFTESNNTSSKEQSQISVVPNKRSWFHMKKPYMKWISGAAAVAVIAGSLTIPAVQVAASNFLSIFRVEKTEMIKLTNDDLQQIEGWLSNGEDGTKELGGIGKVKTEGHHQKQFGSLEKALKAGVSVPKPPLGYHVSNVEENTDWEVTFQLDTVKANKFLKKLNSDVQFDSALNQKEFSISFPENIWASYETDDSKDTEVTFLNVSKTKMPSLKAPADVNLDQLREDVLSLPFIPDNVKKQLVTIDDWKNTLPIPVVQEKSEEVTVNGVKGMYAKDDHSAYMIWQKDGYLYSLDAYISEGKTFTQEDVMKLAEQIK